MFAQPATKYRSRYDGHTLQQQAPVTIMPFNRLVLSAGKVVTYGDPQLENHALDLAALPGNKEIAVEDRYGVAVIDIKSHRLKYRWSFENDPQYKGLLSTYSGIKCFSYEGHTYIVWSASRGRSVVMIAEWNGSGFASLSSIPVNAIAPATTALPNDIAVQVENNIPYLYVVLNGNNQLLKIRFTDKQLVWTAATGVAPYGVRVIANKAYVTNWAGPVVSDSTLEHAGIPWGSAYTDPATGATARGSMSVINTENGASITELPLGLHPNAITGSADNRYLYVANANSDNISVIDVAAEKVVDSINVGLFSRSMGYSGSSPNALQVDGAGRTLYVANGLDNAVCVVNLGANARTNGKGRSAVAGYIPTEAYPGGILLLRNGLCVANIEGKGARVLSRVKDIGVDTATHRDAYNVHQQLASLSFLPFLGGKNLGAATHQVFTQNLLFRVSLTHRTPRENVPARPVPERIGEPSVFRHVVYIIKENKTYDQVYGDLPQGRGLEDLCIYGDSVTPNQHQLATTFSLLDNYYASGKSSAEGHQWTDAAMVSDYIEKMVRAWFRSYPHRQEDAMVYNKNGFIWNNALDHGKTVRIYGEACLTKYDKSLKWADFYNRHLHQEDQGLNNVTTIARIRPVISPHYPDCDNFVFSDQIRADVFIDEWKKYEQATGDSLPTLIVLSLPNDHTSGTAPNFPVPQAMVADNDLALGRIMETITHSRFWDSTVVFVTQDDSQSGWDHISPYRTTGLVLSPYSVLGKAIHTNYNQTGMVRTIEQILGLPPMNVIDATALPMFDCFGEAKSEYTYTHKPNIIPLDKMNKPVAQLKGKALYYARLSANQVFKDLDSGEDDLMNRILWFDARGDAGYPANTPAKSVKQRR